MDRRDFFRGGLRKLQETVVDSIDSHITAKAEHWIRPPYALDEMDFLLACDRCNECITACPHHVIFALPLSCGIQVATTPSMDLLNKACVLCEDWPCVNACKTGALKLTESEDEEGESKQGESKQGAILPPVIAIARINTQKCMPYGGPECGACRGSCPVSGALLWDGDRPRIDLDSCVGCALCRAACIVESKAIDIQSKHKC